MPILNLSPDDQTITVTGDTPLLEVYDALPVGLLPPFPKVDLPDGVGGLVSRGGFAQTFFFGAEVLGISFKAPSGRVIKAGGRTVKNVQGYDLTRPFVGSFGLMGEALDVTFRLRPALCVRHVAAVGQLSDLQGPQARFAWQQGNEVHLMHFGHPSEVELALATLLAMLPNAREITAPLDLCEFFPNGMGVVEGGPVRDLRLAWGDGGQKPIAPALFAKFAASL